MLHVRKACMGSAVTQLKYADRFTKCGKSVHDATVGPQGRSNVLRRVQGKQRVGGEPMFAHIIVEQMR